LDFINLRFRNIHFDIRISGLGNSDYGFRDFGLGLGIFGFFFWFKVFWILVVGSRVSDLGFRVPGPRVLEFMCSVW